MQSASITRDQKQTILRFYSTLQPILHEVDDQLDDVCTHLTNLSSQNPSLLDSRSFSLLFSPSALHQLQFSPSTQPQSLKSALSSLDQSHSPSPAQSPTALPSTRNSQSAARKDSVPTDSVRNSRTTPPQPLSRLSSRSFQTPAKSSTSKQHHLTPFTPSSPHLLSFPSTPLNHPFSAYLPTNHPLPSTPITPVPKQLRLPSISQANILLSTARLAYARRSEAISHLQANESSLRTRFNALSVLRQVISMALTRIHAILTTKIEDLRDLSKRNKILIDQYRNFLVETESYNESIAKRLNETNDSRQLCEQNITTFNWSNPHHFFLAAFAHYSGRFVRPCLLNDVINAIPSHLRLAALSHSQILSIVQLESILTLSSQSLSNDFEFIDIIEGYNNKLTLFIEFYVNLHNQLLASSIEIVTEVLSSTVDSQFILCPSTTFYHHLLANALESLRQGDGMQVDMDKDDLQIENNPTDKTNEQRTGGHTQTDTNTTESTFARTTSLDEFMQDSNTPSQQSTSRPAPSTVVPIQHPAQFSQSPVHHPPPQYPVVHQSIQAQSPFNNHNALQHQFHSQYHQYPFHPQVASHPQCPHAPLPPRSQFQIEHIKLSLITLKLQRSTPHLRLCFPHTLPLFSSFSHTLQSIDFLKHALNTPCTSFTCCLANDIKPFISPFYRNQYQSATYQHAIVSQLLSHTPNQANVPPQTPTNSAHKTSNPNNLSVSTHDTTQNPNPDPTQITNPGLNLSTTPPPTSTTLLPFGQNSPNLTTTTAHNAPSNSLASTTTSNGILTDSTNTSPSPNTPTPQPDSSPPGLSDSPWSHQTSLLPLKSLTPRPQPSQQQSQQQSQHGTISIFSQPTQQTPLPQHTISASLPKHSHRHFFPYSAEEQYINLLSVIQNRPLQYTQSELFFKQFLDLDIMQRDTDLQQYSQLTTAFKQHLLSTKRRNSVTSLPSFPTASLLPPTPSVTASNAPSSSSSITPSAYPSTNPSNNHSTSISTGLDVTSTSGDANQPLHNPTNAILLPPIQSSPSPSAASATPAQPASITATDIITNADTSNNTTATDATLKNPSQLTTTAPTHPSVAILSTPNPQVITHTCDNCHATPPVPINVPLPTSPPQPSTTGPQNDTSLEVLIADREAQRRQMMKALLPHFSNRVQTEYKALSIGQSPEQFMDIVLGSGFGDICRGAFANTINTTSDNLHPSQSSNLHSQKINTQCCPSHPQAHPMLSPQQLLASSNFSHSAFSPTHKQHQMSQSFARPQNIHPIDSIDPIASSIFLDSQPKVCSSLQHALRERIFAQKEYLSLAHTILSNLTQHHPNNHPSHHTENSLLTASSLSSSMPLSHLSSGPSSNLGQSRSPSQHQGSNDSLGSNSNNPPAGRSSGSNHQSNAKLPNSPNHFSSPHQFYKSQSSDEFVNAAASIHPNSPYNASYSNYHQYQYQFHPYMHVADNASGFGANYSHFYSDFNDSNVFDDVSTNLKDSAKKQKGNFTQHHHPSKANFLGFYTPRGEEGIPPSHDYSGYSNVHPFPLEFSHDQSMMTGSVTDLSHSFQGNHTSPHQFPHFLNSPEDKLAPIMHSDLRFMFHHTHISDNMSGAILTPTPMSEQHSPGQHESAHPIPLYSPRPLSHSLLALDSSLASAHTGPNGRNLTQINSGPHNPASHFPLSPSHQLYPPDYANVGPQQILSPSHHLASPLPPNHPNFPSSSSSMYYRSSSSVTAMQTPLHPHLPANSLLHAPPQLRRRPLYMMPLGMNPVNMSQNHSRHQDISDIPHELTNLSCIALPPSVLLTGLKGIKLHPYYNYGLSGILFKQQSLMDKYEQDKLTLENDFYSSSSLIQRLKKHQEHQQHQQEQYQQACNQQLTDLDDVETNPLSRPNCPYNYQVSNQLALTTTTNHQTCAHTCNSPRLPTFPSTPALSSTSTTAPTPIIAPQLPLLGKRRYDHNSRHNEAFVDVNSHSLTPTDSSTPRNPHAGILSRSHNQYPDGNTSTPTLPPLALSNLATPQLTPLSITPHITASFPTPALPTLHHASSSIIFTTPSLDKTDSSSLKSPKSTLTPLKRPCSGHSFTPSGPSLQSAEHPTNQTFSSLSVNTKPIVAAKPPTEVFLQNNFQPLLQHQLISKLAHANKDNARAKVFANRPTKASCRISGLVDRDQIALNALSNQDISSMNFLAANPIPLTPHLTQYSLSPIQTPQSQTRSMSANTGAPSTLQSQSNQISFSLTNYHRNTISKSPTPQNQTQLCLPQHAPPTPTAANTANATQLVSSIHQLDQSIKKLEQSLLVSAPVSSLLISPLSATPGMQYDLISSESTLTLGEGLDQSNLSDLISTVNEIDQVTSLSPHPTTIDSDLHQVSDKDSPEQSQSSIFNFLHHLPITPTSPTAQPKHRDGATEKSDKANNFVAEKEAVVDSDGNVLYPEEPPGLPDTIIDAKKDQLVDKEENKIAPSAIPPPLSDEVLPVPKGDNKLSEADLNKNSFWDLLSPEKRNQFDLSQHQKKKQLEDKLQNAREVPKYRPRQRRALFIQAHDQQTGGIGNSAGSHPPSPTTITSFLANSLSTSGSMYSRSGSVLNGLELQRSPSTQPETSFDFLGDQIPLATIDEMLFLNLNQHPAMSALKKLKTELSNELQTIQGKTGQLSNNGLQIESSRNIQRSSGPTAIKSVVQFGMTPESENGSKSPQSSPSPTAVVPSSPPTQSSSPSSSHQLKPLTPLSVVISLDENDVLTGPLDGPLDRTDSPKAGYIPLPQIDHRGADIRPYIRPFQLSSSSSSSPPTQPHHITYFNSHNTVSQPLPPPAPLRDIQFTIHYLLTSVLFHDEGVTLQHSTILKSPSLQHIAQLAKDDEREGHQTAANADKTPFNFAQLFTMPPAHNSHLSHHLTHLLLHPKSSQHSIDQLLVLFTQCSKQIDLCWAKLERIIVLREQLIGVIQDVQDQCSHLFE